MFVSLDEAGASRAYLPLIAIRSMLAFADADFGSVTVRRPFLNAALTLSSSMSSTGMRRSNLP
jgi:hypothetical protein